MSSSAVGRIWSFVLFTGGKWFLENWFPIWPNCKSVEAAIAPEYSSVLVPALLTLISCRAVDGFPSFTEGLRAVHQLISCLITCNGFMLQPDARQDISTSPSSQVLNGLI